MRFLILQSQQLVGRGPSKNASEMCEWLNENGHHAVIIENTDGNFNKKYKKEGVTYLSYHDDLDALLYAIDKCDIVLNYLFLNEKASDEEINAYVALMKYIKDSGKTNIFFQLCHTACHRELWALEGFEYLLEMFDAVVTFRKYDGAFKDFCDKRKIHPKRLITLDDGIPMLHGIDFHSLKTYWKPFSEKQSKTLMFMGSNVVIKGPWKVRDFHQKYLRKDGWITSIWGMDSSIGALKDLYQMPKGSWKGVVKVPREDVEICLKLFPTELTAGKGAYIFPRFENELGLERMSSSQFGIEFVQGREDELKNIFENAMMEIIAVGTVPVFGKRWADHFIINGKALSEYTQEEIGTVIIDEENPDISLMERLSSDEKLYEAFRSNAFRFYSQYLDVSVINHGLISRIMALSKDSNS